MLPLMTTNISVIKLMLMENDDVLWCEETCHGNVYGNILEKYMEELQNISKNPSIKKYDVLLETTQGK